MEIVAPEVISINFPQQEKFFYVIKIKKYNIRIINFNKPTNIKDNNTSKNAANTLYTIV